MNVRQILRRRVLTIAFHDREVRWTLGSRGAITSFGCIALPDGLMHDGVITDVGQAAALLTRSGVPSSKLMRVLVAIPAQRSVFRVIDVPKLKRPQLDEVIEREIRREMPMLAENAHVGWTIVAHHDDRVSVFVAGAAREVLDSHVAAVRGAKLEPDAVDLRVIAAARAIGHDDVVIANVEDSEIEIAILRVGVPAVIRHVAMNEGSEESWNDQLAAELARTLKFYRDSHRDDDLIAGLPISFVGGAARRAILAPQVPASTGRDVAMPPLRAGLEPEDQAVRYAANIGLALKEIAA
jgi:Tfp pilus assembly PilM family ATPase